MADIVKGEGLKDPVLGKLTGEALAVEQAKNQNANSVMEAQIAGNVQKVIDAKLLAQKRGELQGGYNKVQEVAKNARTVDEEAMARIEAENLAKNIAKPKKGLFGWGFLGL